MPIKNTCTFLTPLQRPKYSVQAKIRDDFIVWIKSKFTHFSKPESNWSIFLLPSDECWKHIILSNFIQIRSCNLFISTKPFSSKPSPERHTYPRLNKPYWFTHFHHLFKIHNGIHTFCICRKAELNTQPFSKTNKYFPTPITLKP